MTGGRLVTLKKSDQAFLEYIWGRFSKTERALPLRSLNVNTEHEQVTFEIVPRLNGPTLAIFLQTLKFRNLYLSLVPLALILLKNIFDQTCENELVAGLSFVAVVFLQLGIELVNDVQDHIRGLDRIHPGAGNIAIAKAWLSAFELRRFSWFFIFFGVLFALPSLILYPLILTTVLPLAFLAILGIYWDRIGLKYRSWSEWIVFLMFGPLLTVGYQLSFGGGFDLEALAIGILSGWLAVFQIHLKNFAHILVNTQAVFNSTVVKLGFDKAKRLLIFWWMIFVLAQVAYHAVFSSEIWLYVHSVLLLLVSIPLISSVNKLQSSVGSKIFQVVTMASRISKFALALWMLENFWIFFLLEFSK